MTSTFFGEGSPTVRFMGVIRDLDPAEAGDDNIPVEVGDGDSADVVGDEHVGDYPCDVRQVIKEWKPYDQDLKPGYLAPSPPQKLPDYDGQIVAVPATPDPTAAVGV